MYIVHNTYAAIATTDVTMAITHATIVITQSQTHSNGNCNIIVITHNFRIDNDHVIMIMPTATVMLSMHNIMAIECTAVVLQ